MDAVVGAARDIRGLYPGACANAMVLCGPHVLAVCSRGTATAPLAAFAARTHGDRPLPPGHDERYNRMSTTRLPSGARVVSTSGVDTTGWDPLPDDAVAVVHPDGVRILPL